MSNITHLPAFRIASISKDYSGRYYSVSVYMPLKAWREIAKAGNLGTLYGVDISNAVYQQNRDVHATCPTVGVVKHNGKAIITLTYMSVSAAEKFR